MIRKYKIKVLSFFLSPLHLHGNQKIRDDLNFRFTFLSYSSPEGKIWRRLNYLYSFRSLPSRDSNVKEWKRYKFLPFPLPSRANQEENKT